MKAVPTEQAQWRAGGGPNGRLGPAISPLFSRHASSLRVLDMKQINGLPKFLLSACCVVGMVDSSILQAQETVEAESSKDWYYGSNQPKVEKKSIAQQKAAARAQQRMARLEAYRWLGYSPTRPPATATPFTSSSSLAWKRARRAPYRWHTSQRHRTYVTWPSYGFY